MPLTVCLDVQITAGDTCSMEVYNYLLKVPNQTVMKDPTTRLSSKISNMRQRIAQIFIIYMVIPPDLESSRWLLKGQLAFGQITVLKRLGEGWV